MQYIYLYGMPRHPQSMSKWYAQYLKREYGFEVEYFVYG